MRAASDPAPPAAFAGHLHLEAEAGPAGPTILARQSFRAPFHIGKSYWDGHALQVRIINPTAGILEGDELELAIKVGAGAALLLVTPAATRAFQMKAGRATCRQDFAVAAGGWLECAPSRSSRTGRATTARAPAWRSPTAANSIMSTPLCPGAPAAGSSGPGGACGSASKWSWAAGSCCASAWTGAGAELERRRPSTGRPRLAGYRGADLASSTRGWPVGAGPRPRRARPPARPDAPGEAGWIVRIAADSSPKLRGALEALRTLCAAALPRLRSDLRRV